MLTIVDYDESIPFSSEQQQDYACYNQGTPEFRSLDQFLPDLDKAYFRSLFRVDGTGSVTVNRKTGDNVALMNRGNSQLQGGLCSGVNTTCILSEHEEDWNVLVLGMCADTE